MRIEAIREFIAVAEKGSFTLAAQTMHISQPALSNHIKAMEDELGGGPLLERAKGSNGAKLTRGGREFYRAMRSLVTDYDRAAEQFRQIQKQVGGHIKIALSPLSPHCNSRMIDLVRDFGKSHPDIDLELIISLPNNLIEALDAGEVDCSVLVQRVSPDEDTHPTAPLCIEETCALMPKTHPLASQSALSIAELNGYPQVHCTHGSIDMTTDFQKKLFEPLGIEPKFSLLGNPSLDDFLVNEIKGDDIVIMPKSFSECAQFQLRPDLVLKPFDPPLMAPSLVIFSGDGDNLALDLFRSHIIASAERA